MTLALDEASFKKLNPHESRIDYSNTEKPTSINFIDNGPQYLRNLNPYEKMVNISMAQSAHNATSFSFEAKAFYEKSLELSLNPNLGKMDDSNPIYGYIANPKDCRYYYYEGI
jgi:hypothetical protein